MSKVSAAPLQAGWGMADITPTGKCELFGQYYRRVARSVRDPLGVTALALDRGGGAPGQAILVSCDQAMVERDLVDEVRGRLGAVIPDFDGSRLVVSATHTHCAPTACDPLKWWVHDPSLLPPEKYREVLAEGLVSAAAAAWKGRSPAQIGTAWDLATVGHCRRPVYRDGSAEMYGRTDRPDFVSMESGQDDTVGVIGVWSARGGLTGLLVNVACPSQVMEATYVVTADMFGEMRHRLRARFGEHLAVLCQVGSAGDQSPRDLAQPYRGGPTYWDEAGMVELGGRLAEAVSRALPRAEAAKRPDLVFLHDVCNPRLPVRTVNPEGYARAAAELAALEAREPEPAGAADSAYVRFVARTREREKLPVPGPYDDKNDDFVLMRNLEAVVERFRSQRSQPEYCPELHVLRLGDTALSTSPFELYLDYGLRIRARGPAALTLHAQLSCDSGGYLPTARAAAAGGYGALIANGTVGPEGGQIVVDSILQVMHGQFEERDRHE